MRRDGSEKRKIKVPLSRRESALAAGTISLERSRSKSLRLEAEGKRKEGNCRFSFHLINFIALAIRERASGLRRSFGAVQVEQKVKITPNNTFDGHLKIILVLLRRYFDVVVIFCSAGGGGATGPTWERGKHSVLR